MKNGRLIRILVFTGIVVGLLFSQVCVIDNQAKPLLDADISLTKTGDPTTFTQAGEEITYTYVVKNTSGYDLESVDVKDDLVSVTCPSTGIDLGEQMTCSGVYTVTQDDVENGEVTNHASVDGRYEFKYTDTGCCGCVIDEGYDYADASAIASFTVTLAPPAISLEKTGDPNFFMGAGEQISYSYVVTNIGSDALAGPVTVDDDLVEVTCPGGGLAPGASLTCTGGYTTTEADVAAGSITNQATASTDDVEAEDSFTVALEINLELELSKSADPTVFSKAGTLLRYDFLVTNTGNVPVDGPFELEDPLLEEQECPEVSLAPGKSLSCVGYYLTRAGDLNTTISNCATVRGYYQEGPIWSPEACTDVYFQAPKENEPEPEPVPE